MALLRSLQSVLSLCAVVLWLTVVAVPTFYLWLLPAVYLRPEKRRALVSRYTKIFAGGILTLLRAGGARFDRTGQLPTSSPILILMNHQSLLDIVTVTLLSSPMTPAFVTRRRYARFIPTISPSIRLLGCPIIDPRHDSKGAVAILKEAALLERHGLLIFPEGHRTRDGSIRPFKPGGVSAILGSCPMPVYAVVTDGFWVSRRFVDFVFNVYKIRGTTEVLGPFECPSETDLPAFLEGIRQLMVTHLGGMRERNRAHE